MTPTSNPTNSRAWLWLFVAVFAGVGLIFSLLRLLGWALKYFFDVGND